MNLDFLESFLDVADLGSMTKVAEQNFLSTATVKRQIDSVEQQLNIKLFNRTSQGMQLTAAGKHFYQKVKPIYTDFQALGVEMNHFENDQTTLNLCTSPDYHFPQLDQIVAKCQQTYPKIRINYQPLKPLSWLNSLKNYENDSCFCVGLEPQQLTHIGLNYLPLEQSKIVCYVSLNHPLAQQPQLTMNDLADYSTLILFSIRFHFAHFIKDHQDIQVDTFDHSRISIINFCNRGGIYVSVDKLKEQHPSFVQIPLDIPPVSIGLYSRKDASNITQAFLAEAKKTLEALN